MRVAFITQCRPHASLGGGRPQFEISREWARSGLKAELLGPEDVLRETKGDRRDLQGAFEQWLRLRGAEFDLIDHDLCFLAPQGRVPDENGAGPVLVSRTVLFLPFSPLLLAGDYTTLWKKLRARWIRFKQERRRLPQPFAPLDQLIPALRRVDALTVPTRRDAAMAEALGVEPNRILTIPYALSREAREALLAQKRPERTAVPAHFVFLGSFDSRKGGPVLPSILAQLRTEFPEARLTLLGGTGDERRIRRAFPAGLQSALRVVPSFTNDHLPSLLADESVGLFPSRFEGFPCAILEQSHAGVPVAAYDAPGAGEQLPRDWLVAPGDADGLARVAVRLLRGLREGAPLVERARAAVARFRIEDVASRTREVYALLCAERGKGRR